MKKKTVALGMSGGVDSSVAVHLLQEQGYEVIGVHMRLIPTWLAGRDEGAAGDARRMAEQFGIAFHELDGRVAFEAGVMAPFAQGYFQGLTPNPCVRCNARIKFGLFYEFAQGLGTDYVATGHYAQIKEHAPGGYGLYQAKHLPKDQSYFLYGIPRTVLPHVLFPIGGYSKEEARHIAERIGLDVAHKGDSQEICFIPDDDYKAFLKRYQPDTKLHSGNFVDLGGQVLAPHQGIGNYTIGQRKGLGLALGYPAYVVDILGNDVVIGRDEHLWQNHLVAREANFLIDVAEGEELAVLSKIRYRSEPTASTLVRKGDGFALTFAAPVRAITPGQSVCCYLGDQVIGGGIIASGTLV